MTESYFKGGDAIQWVWADNLAAQTFVPIISHTLLYIDINYRTDEKEAPSIFVHYCDENHNPVGSPISKFYKCFAQNDWDLYNPFRLRIQMEPIRLVQGIEYAIVLRAPHIIGPWHRGWVYDSSDSLYTRGYRLWSTDGGSTWDIKEGETHMFAEFGDPQSPPVDADPPIDKFVPTNHTVGPFSNGICINFHTNVPVHNFLYWTTKPPLTHKITRVRRGLPTPSGARFCFVAPQEEDQEEDWDSIVKKFTITGLTPCQSVYYTLRGSVDGALTPSCGPIFTHHFTGKSILENPDFEQWPDPPTLPLFWTESHFGSGYGEVQRLDGSHGEGKYYPLIIAHGYASGHAISQSQCDHLYRGQYIRVKAWGGGYAYSNNDLTVAVDGTGGWLRHAAIFTTKYWRQYTVEGPVPSDSNLLTVTLRTYTGSRRISSTHWDDITIEV